MATKTVTVIRYIVFYGQCSSIAAQAARDLRRIGMTRRPLPSVPIFYHVCLCTRHVVSSVLIVFRG